MAIISKSTKAANAAKLRSKKGETMKKPSKVVKKGKQRIIKKKVMKTPARFTIFVHTWTSKVMELQVNAMDTIEYVKEKLESEGGIPKDRQILLLDGRELEDHRALEFYGIADGSMLDQRCRRYVLGFSEFSE